MKKMYLAAFLLFTAVSFAQTRLFKIVDKNTKKELTTAYAENTVTNAIIYANAEGLALELQQSYRIKNLGYQSVEVKITSTTPEVVSLQPKVNSLAEVLITGNRLQDPVMTMVKPDISKYVVQPKNVADLFSGLNGFSLIKRGNYAIDPSFRAAQYEQLNIQYDGGTKVMHACPNRMDPITSHVSPEEISKIEVIKGPFSVRYGATFGGVVNLVTQSAQNYKKGISGSVSSGYETNGNALTTMAKLNYVDNKFDLGVNYGYRDFGNYEDGSNTEIPSSFRSIDYGINLGYNFTEQQRLQLNWRQSYGREVLHASLPMDTEYDDSSIASLDYHINELSEGINALKFKVYYSFVDHLMTNENRPNRSIVEASSPVESTTTGGKLEVDWQLSEAIRVFSGVDAQLIARDGSRTRVVKQNMMGMPLPQAQIFTDKIWQDSYVNTFGFFNEAKWKLQEKTSLTLGARLDLVTSDIKDPEADFEDLYPNLGEREEYNFSFTASIIQDLSDHSTLEFAFGRGLRSANMIERYINHFSVGPDPFEYIGNPNLDAEVNNQFEVKYASNYALNHNFFKGINFEASAYYSIFENYIVPLIDTSLSRKYMPNLEPTNPKVFRNLDEAYKYGFETSLSLALINDFNLNWQSAYVMTKNQDLDEALPLTPPWRNRFTLAYTTNTFWGELAYQVVSKQDELSTSFGEVETPAWQTLDFKAGFNYKSYQFGVAVLNIFDEFYNNHLNFAFTNQDGFSRRPITEPGRNFSVFAKYKF
ncbi:TonB-dependent receptor domain-containing protein [Psychroflexus sp. ALD_RP9]|uniref:TonB-dependent receptor domain-containing protein n=1 Tax=Psychroflexus sp. ALD_RP9 TaxID=2777186 RepID=UPI001A8C02D8|nr:TonB-dependent receptor [Psychroflexus sp. ALD_RP9]QSS96517.1 TonB-dependent receptor [Psychroflexus sp. ALD_RP9]